MALSPTYLRELQLEKRPKAGQERIVSWKMEDGDSRYFNTSQEEPPVPVVAGGWNQPQKDQR